MSRKDHFTIIDTIKNIRSSRIYKKTPRYGERFWVINCTKSIVRIFRTEFNDQNFIEILKDKTAIGKTVLFSCQSFWSHVVKAEILENK